MDKILLICSCAFMVLIYVVIAQENSSSESTDPLAEISNKFDKDLFYELQKQYEGDGFSVTPGHILLTLANFLLYSKGETYDCLNDFFKGENKEDLKKKYKNGTEIIFDVNSGLLLRSSYKIYTDDKNEFCTDFKKTYGKYFKGKIGYADFNNPKQAAKKMNKWINDEEVFETKNKDLVDPSAIKKDGFIVAQTLTLELDYDSGYNPKEIKQIDFNKNSEEKYQLPALYGTAMVKYASIEKYDAQFIDINLKGGNFTFFITLPNKVEGIADVLKKEKEIDLRAEVLPVQKDKCVELTLPFVKLATQGDLTEGVKAIDDLEILFDKKKVDFGCVTKENKPGPINAFFSEVYLTNKYYEDETYEMMEPDKVEDMCADEENLIKIVIDHPFAFSIVNNVVDVNPKPVVMVGIYN